MIIPIATNVPNSMATHFHGNVERFCSVVSFFVPRTLLYCKGSPELGSHMLVRSDCLLTFDVWSMNYFYKYTANINLIFIYFGQKSK